MIRLQLQSLADALDATDPRTSVLTPIRTQLENESINHHPSATDPAVLDALRGRFDRDGRVRPATLCHCGRTKRRWQRLCARCCHDLFKEQVG